MRYQHYYLPLLDASCLKTLKKAAGLEKCIRLKVPSCGTPSGRFFFNNSSIAFFLVRMVLAKSKIFKEPSVFSLQLHRLENLHVID